MWGVICGWTHWAEGETRHQPGKESSKMSLGWGVPTDIEEGRRSPLLGGAHSDLDVTLNGGGSVLLAAGRRMCHTTENGQRGCKTGEGKK